MIITDPKMKKKMDRALKHGMDLYDLDDIGNALQTGHMQAHTVGQTLAITKVHDWPQRRSIEILYVVGNLDEAIQMEERLAEFAHNVGANLITAIGRDGWWGCRTPGWKKVGTLYAKDI